MTALDPVCSNYLLETQCNTMPNGKYGRCSYNTKTKECEPKKQWIGANGLPCLKMFC